MLPRKNRIPTKQFPDVIRGKTKQNDLFRVVFKNDKDLKGPKCAVIVTNKLVKTSVARNLIRRKIYGFLEKNIENLPISYISIFPKKADMTQEEIICLKELLVL